MAHTSLPTWVDDVVGWLASHRLAGTPVAATPARPTISDARTTHKRFRVGSRRTAVSARRRAPIGTSFRFTLSAEANVTITIARPVAGLHRGRSCVAATRKLRRQKAKRCFRMRTVGRLTRASEPRGEDNVRFSGRIGKRALAPRRYEAVLGASNAGGDSNAVRLSFAVVR